MGLRIRKSIKLGKHLKLNLSKSGVSVSGGIKGARVSINTKGVVRKSVGIPGTGVYYSNQHKISVIRKNSKINNKTISTNSTAIQSATMPKKALKKINLIRFGVISLALCAFGLGTVGVGIFMFCLVWNHVAKKNNNS
jgi:hypothetical protein